MKNLYPFRDVPRRVKEITNGTKKPHLSTCFRWKQKGIKGVRLRTICIGAERMCCNEWLLEFFEESTKKRDAARVASIKAGRISAQRDREIEAAEAALDAVGV